MVVRISLPCIVLSCLVILPCLDAKPFSLNALIEAEEKQKLLTTTPTVESETPVHFPLYNILKSKFVKPKKFKRKAETSKQFRFNKVVEPSPKKSKRLKKPENIFSKGKKISSLQYTKTLQNKSPLKPKKSKYTEKRGHRTQSSKREISEDERLFRKYLPLLRSLDMLLDNILDKGSGDSHDASGIVFGGDYHRNVTRRNTTCTCSYSGADTEGAESATTKATVITTTASDEITVTESARTEATTAAAYNTTTSDVSSVGRYSNVSPLPTGNTASIGRDNNTVISRSRTAPYSSAEGNISGDHRNSEYDTRSRENSARAKSSAKDSDSPSRDYANSARFRGGGRRDKTDFERPVYGRRLYSDDYSTKSEKSFRDTGRDVVKPKGKDQFESRGDQTESSEFVPKSVRGHRGSVPRNIVQYDPKPVQSEKNNEESGKSVEFDVSGHQRVAVGNGPSSSEDQEINETNTASVISNDDLNNNPFITLQSSPKHKAPYVTIFDGYSVAKDKNGANKLAEHSIRVHT